MSRWRERAEHVITKALAEVVAQSLDEKATLALVDSRYPFGVRDYHPYQMWLKVRRELVPSLKAKEAEKVKQKQAAIKNAWIEQSGQGELPL